MSYVGDVLNNNVPIDSIDDYVVYWHTDQTVDVPLYAFLGFTEEQFTRYVEHPLSLPDIFKEIQAERDYFHDHMEKLRASDAPMGSAEDLRKFLETYDE